MSSEAQRCIYNLPERMSIIPFVNHDVYTYITYIIYIEKNLASVQHVGLCDCDISFLMRLRDLDSL